MRIWFYITLSVLIKILGEHLIKSFISTALLMSSVFASIASADQVGDQYVCKSGENTRTITVNYRFEGDPVPCEVSYEKDSGVQILWNAKAEIGYCESKAKEFIAKQESWGWVCTQENSADNSAN